MSATTAKHLRPAVTALLPTTLVLSYSYGGEWDLDAERGWRSSWMLYGQRALRSGAISDKRPVSMQDFDFPSGQIPAWITDAVERHHPESAAYINADDGYHWLTCSACDTPLHCNDGGDTLAELNAAVTAHTCPAAQGASDAS